MPILWSHRRPYIVSRFVVFSRPNYFIICSGTLFTVVVHISPPSPRDIGEHRWRIFDGEAAAFYANQAVLPRPPVVYILGVWQVCRHWRGGDLRHLGGGLRFPISPLQSLACLWCFGFDVPSNPEGAIEKLWVEDFPCGAGIG